VGGSINFKLLDLKFGVEWGFYGIEIMTAVNQILHKMKTENIKTENQSNVAM
jgi:hypothetical protein